MKTAVSIKDDLFKKADKVAKKLGLSRSELYAMAVQSWVDDYLSDSLTEALNEIYSKESSTLDPALAEMQSRSIPREDW